MKNPTAKMKTASPTKPNAAPHPYDNLRLKPNCIYYRDPIFPDVMICQHDNYMIETVER